MSFDNKTKTVFYNILTDSILGLKISFEYAAWLVRLVYIQLFFY
jgi:hypothetical protein